METKKANSKDSNEITIRDLIKASLRMRPDRIIVGEVRGPEALDMLQAMNTGHDGSLSTGHANSPEGMLSRLETMVLTGSAELPLEAIRSRSLPLWTISYICQDCATSPESVWRLRKLLAIKMEE